ncbi:MAG: hypothetical protein CMG63_04795 [Candidatus Marinimicrobia bacterium]|nr:hypothetical protein [Candidatus Neomarinimicrobiota bacterium]
MSNKNLKLIILDSLVCVAAIYLAFILRFEFSIPKEFLGVFYKWVPFFVLFQVGVFYFSGLYARIWRYTSLFDLYAILSAVLTAGCFSIIYVVLTMGSTGYPRSVLLLYLILNGIATVSVRLCVRVYFSHYHTDSVLKNPSPKKIVLLIGAGKTGEKIAREIRTTLRNQYILAGFVDDNIEKQGAILHGKKVFCRIDDIPNLKIKYDELIITAPSASGDQIRRIVDICKQTGKRYKTVPALNEIIDGEISMAAVRDVSYSDLLGRDEVKLDMNSIDSLLHNKRVLITGAGGSIGSELVKQCLTFNPSEIICVDINEESIYNLDQSFNKIKTKTILRTVLASVNSKIECDKIFSENRPQVVFHAAAYKHVPIQEVHPWTAVNTNIGGTLNMVELSDKFSVEKFVLVSTDKAVNPVNVMGATKRAAEKLIQSYNDISNTKFMAVRFGNVLGSSGSAIPTFQKQINEGGPLTITHPEMTRYFMSIQEASQLILQCGALGRDGEIFLLEMGKPIRIVQMARDLIRLSGLEPEVDIPIVYTGLRPGEKLYEELQLLNEKKVKTSHKKIMILKDRMSHVPWSIFQLSIQKIMDSTKNLDSEMIQLLLKEMLPTYSPITFKSNIDIKSKVVRPNIKAEA